MSFSELKTLEIFSGCGGGSEGFKKAGFKIVAANDIWLPAATTYRLNNPGVKFIQGDITENSVKDQILACFPRGKRCDVIFGGPPCQAYSFSGKRDPRDPRGHLFNDYIDIVAKLSPKIFIMENVAGLFSMKHEDGGVPNKILSGFGNIGYSVKGRVLDAANYGDPQHRKRAILFGVKFGANSIDIPFPASTHGPGLKPYMTVREAIGDLADLPENEESSHIFINHSQQFINKIKSTPVGKSVGRYGEAFFRALPDKPSPTVKGNHGGSFIHYQNDRGMTPRELARLQGFPDDFIFKGTKSDLFTMIGNAIPFNLAYAIAMTIHGYL
jgi:DNA (cytosine-5)-methyltransferase 1